MRRGFLAPVEIEGARKVQHWGDPDTFVALPHFDSERVHILSPFDPLVIQRARLKLFFDYEHRFEAYVPKEKRVMGYFALPVLVGDQIVAAIDIKADRAQQALQIQQWTWLGEGVKRHRSRIEAELHRFERFQLRFQAQASEEL